MEIEKLLEEQTIQLNFFEEKILDKKRFDKIIQEFPVYLLYFIIICIINQKHIVVL